MSPVVRRVLASLPPAAYRHLPVEVRADARAWLGRWEPGDIGYVPVAPEPAAGERTGPPGFVLLGAPEPWGPWWMSYLADHPEVVPHRTLRTASRFFAPFGAEAFGPDDADRFRSLFPRRPGRLTGHWSPDGLAHPWVLPLLAEVAPDARILVLVRDPIDQLRADVARTPDDGARHLAVLAGAVDRMFTGEQLARLQRWYPPDRVLVLQVERCLADPEAALARTFAFLGVDDTYRTRPLPAPVEPERPPLAPSTLDRLVELVATDTAALAELVPSLDPALWPTSFPPE